MSKEVRNIDNSWNAIFKKYNIDEHNFDLGAYEISAKQIKDATKHLPTTGEQEVRIICKQDSRENRPKVFDEKGLFLLPIKNGKFAIIKGEGYVDIPEINSTAQEYNSKLDFELDTSKVGDSEMQHLDFAYASSLIRTFMNDDSLVLTIRGRKYTPKVNFKVGDNELTSESVQTEVDSGYEGKNQIVLVEAKNSKTKNTIIRQLYYPYRQWKFHTNKDVKTLFFEKRGDECLIWEFIFEIEDDYNSIKLSKNAKFIIK